ncbi:MAG TPA: hypothetical protein P5323_04230 [Candidatus Moranbacteria bacterium]|nr:hypothetical protein [Candidatus Moranbacteria bacterium]HRY28318.1 hypothetical protein [Candidatus Moranbacteria bacterium]HSA08721.1 hypothetical protein [Candidatus Moranbacteria bacterium]
MSDLIEKTVSNYMANKKIQDDEQDIKLPGDTMSVAREVDDRLDSFKDYFNRLKSRIEKERLLLEEVKKATEKTIDNIIGK